MGGKQSLTRNLNGAGKGDKMRPRLVSAEQERKNWEKIFGKPKAVGKPDSVEGTKEDG